MNRSISFRALLTACTVMVILAACDSASMVTEPHRELPRPRMSVASDTTQVLHDGGGTVGSGHVTTAAGDDVSQTEARGGVFVGSGH